MLYLTSLIQNVTRARRYCIGFAKDDSSCTRVLLNLARLHFRMPALGPVAHVVTSRETTK